MDEKNGRRNTTFTPFKLAPRANLSDTYYRESIIEFFCNAGTTHRSVQKKEAFLIWLKEIQETKLGNESKDYEKYRYETSIDLKNDIYSTFDYYLNDKYKVEINHQTLERLKNYFR